MRAVFGPVPSRRLGRSLGIDPVPFKTCNWNCIYCQLGRTSPIKHQRREYLGTRVLLDELRATLERLGPDAVDWLTFVGSGEPTLHIDLGHMIRQVKDTTDLPIAVITNGATLYRPDVRHDLSLADAVMPTLAAGNEELFLRIHRPARELGYHQFVQGLLAFRRGYRGALWLEVMLLNGINDSEEALNEIATVVSQVKPDEIHLTLPTRPPNEPLVSATDADGLARAESILGKVGRLVAPNGDPQPVIANGDLGDAIEAIVTRHPMREEELEAAFAGLSQAKLRKALDQLRIKDRIQLVQRRGQEFWTCSQAVYVDAWPRRHEGDRETSKRTRRI